MCVFLCGELGGTAAAAATDTEGVVNVYVCIYECHKLRLDTWLTHWQHRRVCVCVRAARMPRNTDMIFIFCIFFVCCCAGCLCPLSCVCCESAPYVMCVRINNMRRTYDAACDTHRTYTQKTT